MNAIIFDTETNGKPKSYGKKMTDLWNWPRVIELAWRGVTIETREVWADHSFLIKPHGWKIPVEQFWIDHGFSTEKNELSGATMPSVLGLFSLHAKNADVIVAHNMDFDHPVLGAEMIRYKVTTGKSLIKICTMKSGTDFCKLPGGRNGEYKWPKLEELYKALFGKSFTGAHAAGNDMDATMECFFEMVKRGLVVIPTMKPV